MRIDRGLLDWGAFLIVLGAVPLAARAGYLDTDTLRRAWELWPLVLIGIGLGLILQRTRAGGGGGPDGAGAVCRRGRGLPGRRHGCVTGGR